MGKTRQETADNILKKEIKIPDSRQLSPQIADLIHACLNRDVNKRLDSRQVQNHRAFNFCRDGANQKLDDNNQRSVIQGDKGAIQKRKDKMEENQKNLKDEFLNLQDPTHDRLNSRTNTIDMQPEGDIDKKLVECFNVLTGLRNVAMLCYSVGDFLEQNFPGLSFTTCLIGQSGLHGLADLSAFLVELQNRNLQSNFFVFIKSKRFE